MRVLGLINRRSVVVAALTALLMPALASAQTPPPAQQPAAPLPVAPDPYMFGSRDHVILMIQVNPGQGATFEEAWEMMRAGLAKSAKPEQQQQAASLPVLKLDVAGALDAALVYVVHMAPPVAGQSYDPLKILFDSGAFERADADKIYDKLKASVKSYNPWPMAKVSK